MSFLRIQAAAVASLVVAFGGSALADDPVSATPPAAMSHSSLVPFMSLDISGGWPYDHTTTGGFSTDMGMQLGGSIGVGLRTGPVLVEVQYEEHTFFLNNLNPIPPATLPVTDYEGDVDIYAMTAQVAVEFGETSFMRPYIGLAGGIAGISADYYENICALCSPGAQFVAESDFALVWSGTMGLTFNAGGRAEYYIGYRHIRTADFDLSTTGGAAFKHKGLRSDSIELGIRVNFN